jgi:hypothetical protein
MYGNFPEKKWYLYDATDGRIVLKHPFRRGMEIPCPYCGSLLIINDYKATCCGQLFKTAFYEIHQVKPFGYQNRKTKKGWASLRPYSSNLDLF